MTRLVQCALVNAPFFRSGAIHRLLLRPPRPIVRPRRSDPAVAPPPLSRRVSRWCEFDLEARMPVRDIRRRTPSVALCRTHRWNRAQSDQSGRCAARNGIRQLAETDFDLLRTLRGV